MKSWRLLRRVRPLRVPIFSELRYLRSVEVAANTVVDCALAEGWLAYAENDAPATPLHGSVNEMARHLRHRHFKGDGCTDH